MAKDAEDKDVDGLISVDRDERGRLKKQRLASGMRQADLARKLKVTPATISNLETGRHPQIRRSLYAQLRRVLAQTDGRPSAETEEKAYREIVDGVLDLSAKDMGAVAALVNSLRKPG